MRNKLAIIGFSVLGVALAVTAYAMSNEEVDCQREAIVDRLDAEIDSFLDFDDNVHEARRDRRNATENAWFNPVDRERNEELRRIEQDYRELLNDFTADKRDREKDIKDTFNEDVKACREEQRDRCLPIQCERRRVATCDRDGNPIVFNGDPCQSSSSSRSSSSRSSSRSSSSSSRSSSRSSSSRSSSSSYYPVCGDGRCEGNENVVVCNQTNQLEADNTFYRQCRRVCEADCGGTF